MALGHLPHSLVRITKDGVLYIWLLESPRQPCRHYLSLQAFVTVQEGAAPPTDEVNSLPPCNALQTSLYCRDFSLNSTDPLIKHAETDVIYKVLLNNQRRASQKPLKEVNIDKT